MLFDGAGGFTGAFSMLAATTPSRGAWPDWSARDELRRLTVGLFYDNVAGHMRMDVAEIFEGAGRAKRDRVAVISIQRLRSGKGFVV